MVFQSCSFREQKTTQIHSERIEKYKTQIESINREGVELRRMLKHKSNKNEKEIKREKREITIKRQQQEDATEQNKLVAK